MKVSISITFSLFLFCYFPISYSSKHHHHYTSLFSFGDSLADTGNLLTIGTPTTGAAAGVVTAFPVIGRKPYGMTYFGHPTGRCSDGRLVIDFIAQALGLPLLPPFLGAKKNFKKGVNFAFTGATALDHSFFVEKGIGGSFGSNYSLNTQLGWFKGLKPSLCHSHKDCREYFKRSLFIVGEFGGNDYTYPLVYGNGSLQEVTTYAPKVVEAIANATQTLIDLGAINLVIPGTLPTGCIPVYLSLGRRSNQTEYDSKTGCINKLNDFSKYHNKLLNQALQQLRLKNPHAKIIYANYYDAVFQVDCSPEKYGFTREILKTCCGGGGGPYNLNVTKLCGLPTSTVAGDPKSYLYWDGIHLTEAGNHHIAKGLLYGPYASQPIMH